MSAPRDPRRPLGLLLALAVVVCAPTTVYAVLLVVTDLTESTGELDGLGTMIGLVLLSWVLVAVALPGAAWVARRRPTPCAVLAVLGGFAVWSVGGMAPTWFMPPAPYGTALGVAMTLLGLAAAGLGILVAVQCSRRDRPPQVASPVG